MKRRFKVCTNRNTGERYDDYILADLSVPLADFPYYLTSKYNKHDDAFTASIEYCVVGEKRIKHVIGNLTLIFGENSGRLFKIHIHPFSDSSAIKTRLEQATNEVSSRSQINRYRNNIHFGSELIKQAMLRYDEHIYI